MKIHILFLVLCIMLIGTGIAQNTTTGDVKAFKQALEKDGFTLREGGLGYFDFMNCIIQEYCLLHMGTIHPHNIWYILYHLHLER